MPILPKAGLGARMFPRSGAGGKVEHTAALAPGQLVMSRAGRDLGQIFVVLAVEDGHFARVADGRARPVTRPKRKNMRHLQAHGPVDASLVTLIRQGAPSDREVREAIATFRDRHEGCAE